MTIYLARISKGKLNQGATEGEFKQLLSEHLTAVARRTAESLPPFLYEVGWYAGLWHDLGKYIPKWQCYLRGETKERVFHSHQGALLAIDRYLEQNRSPDQNKSPDLMPAIAFVIAGHHTGLKNRSDLELEEFEQYGNNYKKALEIAQQEIPSFLPPQLPDIKLPTLQREFAIRMLFSALVDSDRLDAREFDQKNNPPQEQGDRVHLQSKKCLNPRSLSKFEPSVLQARSAPIDQLRNVFANYCITNAKSSKGLFRLTGACGIGKTRASLRFALLHGEHNNMAGIIYVGPLKSIVEQTANDYRELLDEASVLEHHSGFEPEAQDVKNYRLDTERWDKPFILTSGVQFYESLFSNLPSQCRKLHNIANRVILIDEAQTIPLNLVIPILDVLETLVKDWGCTVVLMSATQPAFDRLQYPTIQAIDIVPQEVVIQQFQELERVTYQISLEKPWTWQDIGHDIINSEKQQTLVVVNTTRLAREGYQKLVELVETVPGSWFHLSTRMCPQHRQQVLHQIKALLQDEKPCYLISTQLIEAGVDLDFSRVYRQLGPLDSIIQAAGRCNRNGKLEKQAAVVTVFELEDKTKVSTEYQNRIAITRAILEQNPQALSNDLLNSIQHYFRQVYNEIHGGGKEIQQLRCSYNYPKVAQKFRVIDDNWQQSVVVPWQEGAALISELKNQTELRQEDWQKLQKYTVGLPSTSAGQIEKYANGLQVWLGPYDPVYGIEI